MSVCAHGAPARVRSRTRGGRFGRLRVRLCTRRLLACAKSDTKLAVASRPCPLVHTGRLRVCKVGHEKADSGGLVSGKAHGTPARVHKRTRRRARGPRASARARGQRPASPRGRPKRSLRADKGYPRSRFSARLTRRGAPQIAGRHARPAGANPRRARRRSTGRASRWARDEDVREGVRNAQLFVTPH